MYSTLEYKPLHYEERWKRSPRGGSTKMYACSFMQGDKGENKSIKSKVNRHNVMNRRRGPALGSSSRYSLLQPETGLIHTYIENLTQYITCVHMLTIFYYYFVLSIYCVCSKDESKSWLCRRTRWQSGSLFICIQLTWCCCGVIRVDGYAPAERCSLLLANYVCIR
jgi:hypothetical protein